MTAPVSLVPGLPCSLPGAAATDDPDDVFASLLVALTTAIGMPMPPQHGPATHLAPAGTPAAAVAVPASSPPVSATAMAPAPTSV